MSGSTQLQQPVLEVRGVSCALGGRPVLHDVDLAVHPGTMTVVVGPNGAGKSTLLGALSGDVVPTAGAVHLDGTDLRSWATADLARRRAVLAQGNDVSFGFSVREVVTMGRHPWWRQADVADDERIVGESLALADVEHLADRAFRELSGGEKARVSLARVLAQDTEVVLLDEPTAALDLQHQESVMALAGRLARRGRTVVVVAHDLSLASAHADVLVVVDRGRVAAAAWPLPGPRRRSSRRSASRRCTAWR